MKILMATFGSRGDVEPFVNLSREAFAKGHEVSVLTTAEFGHDFDSAVHHVALPGSVKDLIAQTQASPLEATRIFSTVIKPLMIEGMKTLLGEATRFQPDVIVFHPKIVAAPLVAARVGAVAVQVEFAPITVPTSEFASAGFGTYSLGPFNKLTYSIVNGGSRQLFAKELAALRAELGVKPAAVSTVIAASPTLVPRPTDYPQSAVITGQWSATAPQLPVDDRVSTFCSKPTIAVTFGSMIPPASAVKAIITAARREDLQVLLIGGWSGIEADYRDDAMVLALDSIPHESVFPLCELVVHHGGAGTTHAAARAGTPQWIVPILADQPWWRAATVLRGIGVSGGSAKRLTVDTATKAIRARFTLGARAKQIAASIARENGCRDTIDYLEGLTSKR